MTSVLIVSHSNAKVRQKNTSRMRRFDAFSVFPQIVWSYLLEYVTALPTCQCCISL